MNIVKPYLWMTDFTPQKEWIDGKGVLLWLAFFFSEIGAGVYLVSLFFGSWFGCLAGWIGCAVLGGGFHVAYLGRPGRAWRSILRPGGLKGLRAQWIVRGTLNAKRWPGWHPGAWHTCLMPEAWCLTLNESYAWVLSAGG